MRLGAVEWMMVGVVGIGVYSIYRLTKTPKQTEPQPPVIVGGVAPPVVVGSSKRQR